MLETPLEQKLVSSYKADLISFLDSHPEYFEEVLQLGISDRPPYSWRAAWLLWSCMEENDIRVHSYIGKIVDILPFRKDEQVRELLIILQKMELEEVDEGRLFDICLNIWEGIGKKPSTRYHALKVIVKIAGKHPELWNEIDLIVQDQYLESLSENVRKSIFRMIKRQ